MSTGKKRGMTRRFFVKALGIGAAGTAALALGGFVRAQDEQHRVDGPEDVDGAFHPDVFLTVTPDSTILLAIPKAEMGQGTTTGYVTLVAEELGVSPGRITYYYADGAPEYRTMGGMQLTGGSTAIIEGWPLMRKVGATARDMLLAAAAAVSGVPAAKCRITDDGITAGGKVLTFGSLCTEAAKQPVPENPTLKNAKDYAHVGKPGVRVDARPKTNGTAGFGIDVLRPGMKKAYVIHPPVFGATAKSVESAAAKAEKGVSHVVTIPAGVAVVADKFWQAKAAAQKVKVTWTGGHDTVSTSALSAKYATEPLPTDGKNAIDEGDVDAALAAANTERVHTVRYSAPYLAHAPMEPQNFTAHVTDGRCELWGPTQSPTVVQEAAAQLLGIERNDVVVHTTFLGGGFGRRSGLDFALEAVACSQAVGGPVQVIWTREHDMQGGFYRPIAFAEYKAALGDGGKPAAIDVQLAVPPIFKDMGGMGGAGMPDWVPPGLRSFIARKLMKALASGALIPDVIGAEGSWNYGGETLRVHTAPLDVPVPVTFWRSVGHSYSAFFAEAFVDELAEKADQDPVAYRLALLEGQPRAQAVLKKAAAMAGWRHDGWKTPLKDGVGRGVAVHESFGSYVAQVVEARVESGSITVEKVFCAADVGVAVTPDLVKAQMEGGIIYGMSAALMQKIDIEAGKVVQENFDTYPAVRMHESPVIDVHVMASAEDPGGAGEPGLPPIAPAIANAVYRVTQKRLHALPLTVG